MQNIGLSVELKRQVESIECTRCKGVRLTFQKVEYDEDFIFEDGGSVVVDTYCKSCNAESAVIVQIPAS